MPTTGNVVYFLATLDARLVIARQLLAADIWTNAGVNARKSSHYNMACRTSSTTLRGLGLDGWVWVSATWRVRARAVAATRTQLVASRRGLAIESATFDVNLVGACRDLLVRSSGSGSLICSSPSPVAVGASAVRLLWGGHCVHGQKADDRTCLHCKRPTATEHSRP